MNPFPLNLNAIPASSPHPFSLHPKVEMRGMKGVQTAREGSKEGERGEVGGKPRKLLLWRRVSAFLSTIRAQGAEKGEVSGDFSQSVLCGRLREAVCL